MKKGLQEFVMGAFGLIALFLALTHAGGGAALLGATTGGLATDFKALQGR